MARCACQCLALDPDPRDSYAWQEVQYYEKMEVRDIHNDMPLAAACQMDVEKHCKDIKSGMHIIALYSPNIPLALHVDNPAPVLVSSSLVLLCWKVQARCRVPFLMSLTITYRSRAHPRVPAEQPGAADLALR